MGADLTAVATAIANNISAVVRLAAIDIGGLSALGSNGVLLGGPDALTAAAVICGSDICERGHDICGLGMSKGKAQHRVWHANCLMVPAWSGSSGWSA